MPTRRLAGQPLVKVEREGDGERVVPVEDGSGASQKTVRCRRPDDYAGPSSLFSGVIFPIDPSFVVRKHTVRSRPTKGTVDNDQETRAK